MINPARGFESTSPQPATPTGGVSAAVTSGLKRKPSVTSRRASRTCTGRTDGAAAQRRVRARWHGRRIDKGLFIDRLPKAKSSYCAPLRASFLGRIAFVYRRAIDAPHVGGDIVDRGPECLELPTLARRCSPQSRSVARCSRSPRARRGRRSLRQRRDCACDRRPWCRGCDPQRRRGRPPSTKPPRRPALRPQRLAIRPQDASAATPMPDVAERSQ